MGPLVIVKILAEFEANMLYSSKEMIKFEHFCMITMMLTHTETMQTIHGL